MEAVRRQLGRLCARRGYLRRLSPQVVPSWHHSSKEGPRPSRSPPGAVRDWTRSLRPTSSTRGSYDSLTSDDAAARGWPDAIQGVPWPVLCRRIMGGQRSTTTTTHFFRSRVFRGYAKDLPLRVKPIGRMVETMKQMGLDAPRSSSTTLTEGKSTSAFCSGSRSHRTSSLAPRRRTPRGLLVRLPRVRSRHPLLLDRPPRQLLRQIRGGERRRRDLLDLLRRTHPREALPHRGAGALRKSAKNILRRYRFNSIFFATFYAANSTLKLRYTGHDELSFQRPSTACTRT